MKSPSFISFVNYNIPLLPEQSNVVWDFLGSDRKARGSVVVNATRGTEGSSKMNSNTGKDPELGDQHELKNLDQNPGRFQVAKVDNETNEEDEETDNFSSTTPNQQHSYGYDSRHKSLVQLTREVPPRLEHYRHLSVQYEYRPTLDELHEGNIPEKVGNFKYKCLTANNK
ncbi:hypothetical protein L9F63_018507 [Diploptera punctata]|uniref:Uncharacterized protein n=1 Tax=Diploptera punctata TaxID=6984 RepID=A0AAD8EFF1_DIPPU|nr:hypothetical protein L9F63_018507 [Diploptera punctata]